MIGGIHLKDISMKAPLKNPATKGKGLFVVLEGIDGSGKTSVGKEVVSRLNSQGINATFTFEPSDLPVGKLLRTVLSGSVETDPHTHALLFAADREEHLRREIIPLLEKGELVVCDRYVYASMAYQGAKGVNMEYIWEINRKLPHFLVPDLLLLLDIQPDISLLRTTHRENADIFETPDYLGKVRENYLKLAADHEMKIVDAGMEMVCVVEAVLGKIMDNLKE